MIHRYVKITPPFAIKFLERFSPGYFLHATNLRRNQSDSSRSEGSDRKNEKEQSGSRVSFNFHPETEAIFNQQVNAEFKAFYCYLSMASYFGRVDVALSGCESFFTQMHEEEHEHALQCLNYIKMRGGKINLCTIESPTDQDWKCPLNAFKVIIIFIRNMFSMIILHKNLVEISEISKTALQLEIDVTEKLVGVNSVATKHGDLNASDFIVTNFMESQMRSISEIGRFVTVLSGVGDQSLARFLFDKDLLENHVSAKFNILKGKTSLHAKQE